MRVSPPNGKTWNSYSKEIADAAPDQSLAGRRAAKRDLKLTQIAAIERSQPSPSLRTYHTYSSPGTVSPAPHRPWI